MKKLLLAILLLTLSAESSAHGSYYYNNNSDWVAPLIIGGVVGYVISQPRTVVVQQPVYQSVPNYTPTTQPIYQYQVIYFNECNCYRRVLVQTN